MQTTTKPIIARGAPLPWHRPMNLFRIVIAIAGIVLAIVVSPAVRAAAGAGGSDPAALWGLMPIALYAVLAISGMSILVSTLVALAAALLLNLPTLSQAGDMLVGSLTNQVTIIGFIIALGAGVGGVLRETGVAQVIVGGVLRLVGHRGPRTVALGIMLACLVLVASLGTLAGALAIAAPLLIPVAARLGYTRIATATLMFVGGCAGLALAPFAGSNVAIMQAANVGYGQYVLYGAGPLAALTLAVGLVWVPIVQKRSARAGNFYSAEEAADTSAPITSSSRRATVVFAGLLVVLVAVAIVTGVGLIFPLMALPLLAIATGIGAKLPLKRWFAAMGRGMWSMAGVFAMFWLLAVLFLIIDRLQPFDTVLTLLGPQLQSSSPFLFTLIVALIGWVGVPGATAAQVVLIDKVFGPLAGEMGVSAGSWVIVLLFASKADTYGPFPNPNMVSTMGLARSKNLRMMLLTGWMLLVPATLMYALMLFLETR
ncbi:Na+/H+ antiporter NhaC [Leucobacter exalbidus]|uniref:Na+/H+ antiporter NhaC n=1 Tax=Leucobacter exalbidus TaxID=662960 RepID=A0A940SZT3_9MICO|nr:Na+/H+ antiporter NhaC family protein [Leucobacter exalbidus]MBP1325215.1 Na+/H+ antiporter NhaC [Leucobacter exalbidus]